MMKNGFWMHVSRQAAAQRWVWARRSTRVGAWGLAPSVFRAIVQVWVLVLLLGLPVQPVWSASMPRPSASLPAAAPVGGPVVPAPSAQPGGVSDGSPARAVPLIMLLTDFGTRGYLLGSLKGAIYRAFPGARIDSLTHDIPKFDIEEAAQTLVLSSADYPAGTLFVVVVDPGMGRPRTPIALETLNGHIYLGPDNGVLTQVAIRYGIKRIHDITSPVVIRSLPQESSFLSRDVLGPAAAALAQGFDVSGLGASRTTLFLLTAAAAKVTDTQIEGTVSLVDGFGNAHTNVRRDQLEKLNLKEGDTLLVVVGDVSSRVKLVKGYGDVPKGSVLARFGSHDEVQLAINQGNLAETWKIEKGAVIVFKRP